jgi:LuxR family maltose regulon positive regulatory protein
LVQRKAWDDVAAYLDTHWTDLTHSNREVLATTLNAMPTSVLASHARLAAAREYANFLPARGPARPTRYQHAPGKQTNLLDTLAQLTSQSAGARMIGRFDDGVAAAEEALRVLRQSPAAATRAISPVLPDLRLQWAISLQLGGRIPEAIRAYERAYDESIRHENTRIAVEAAGSLAFDFAYLGMPKQAREWLARVPEYDHDGSDTVHEMAGLAAALLAAFELDPAGAKETLAAVPAVSSETWAMRFFVESFSDSLAGRSDGFTAKLLALRTSRPAALGTSGLNGVVLALASAEAALYTTDSARADAAFTDLAALSELLPAGVLELLRAWRAIREDDLAAALALASRPLSAGTASPVVAAELRAVLTVVHLRSAQDAEAAAQFLACLEIVREERLFGALHRLTPEERERVQRLTGENIPDEARVALAAVSPRARQPRRPSVRLTPRERVVLRHLVEGRSRAEIARAESLSLNTIKTQTTAIYRKLNVTDRHGAVQAVLATPDLLL